MVLTEKSEGSEVIDISYYSDSQVSYSEVRIIEECKCNIRQVRNINDYGMCKECPTYDLICCQDVVVEPGLLFSFVASVETGFKIHDKDDMAVNLLGDRFHCDPVRYIYHVQYIVVAVLHNFAGPDAMPLCFKTGENIKRQVTTKSLLIMTCLCLVTIMN